MKRRRGYTIIEVFLALVLVASSVVALAQLMPTSMGCLRRSAETTAADNLGRGYMETYRVQSFQALTPLIGNPKNFNDTLDGVQYNSTLYVTVGSDANVYQLEVVVGWDNGAWTGMQTVDFNTCVYNVINPI